MSRFLVTKKPQFAGIALSETYKKTLVFKLELQNWYGKHLYKTHQNCMKGHTFIQVDELLVHFFITSLPVLWFFYDMSTITNVMTNSHFFHSTFRILKCFSCFLNLYKKKKKRIQCPLKNNNKKGEKNISFPSPFLKKLGVTCFSNCLVPYIGWTYTTAQIKSTFFLPTQIKQEYLKLHK